MTQPFDREGWSQGERAGELGLDKAEVARLLVVLPAGMPSAIAAIAALRHLRRAYPEALLTVAGDASVQELLASAPFIDRVLVGRDAPELRIERFDLVISMVEPSQNAAVDVDVIAATMCIMWGDGPRPAAVEHIVDVALPQSATMAERMYRLAWLVGGDDAGEPNGKLWSSLADRREAAKLTGEDVRPLAVLHVGAPMAASAWSNIADVLDGAGMRVAIVGENVDVDLAHDVTIDARCAPIDLAGKMSVGAMVGVLERAVLFVGPDRGPATLAALLEVRSVIAGVGVSEELASSPSRRVVMCRGDDQTQQVRAHAAITSEVSIAALAAMEQWRAQRV